MIPFINLKAQYRHLQKEINQAVKKVVKSGWYLAGEETAHFEKEFAQFVGVKYAIALASGTDALLLSLIALGIGPGDEVITCPNTWVSTVSTIIATGAKPVFVDINPETFLIDINQIESKINSRTKAILPVHLFGLPVNMPAIVKIAKKYQLKIVEDACQAHGAKYQGQNVGAFGDIGCFSFYPTKNLGAYGDAGAIVTNNRQLAQKISQMCDYGRVKRDDHRERIFNSLIDEIQAAILRVKLKYLKKWNRKRTQIAAVYNKFITANQVEKPNIESKGEPCWHLYVIKTSQRNQLQQYLKREGIETLIHFPKVVYLQGSFASIGIPGGTFYQAEKLSREILSLPIYPELKLKEARLIAQKVNLFFKK